MTMPKVSKEMEQEINDSFVKKSVFETLNAINVNDKTEKKNGLTYLSWAWAWGEVKKKYPDTNYTIYERMTDYGPVNYFTDGKTCWVKTGVTVDGIEYIEELPVMDFKNKSIALNSVTSFDVNKAIQRSLTKALARHGLGLYIYAGEDLPEDEKEENDNEKPKKKESAKPQEKAEVMATEDQIKIIQELGSEERIEGMKKYYKVNELSELTINQASEAIKILKGKKE